MIRSLIIAGFLSLVLQSSAFCIEEPPSEPGWTHGVVLFGEAREKERRDADSAARIPPISLLWQHGTSSLLSRYTGAIAD